MRVGMGEGVMTVTVCKYLARSEFEENELVDDPLVLSLKTPKPARMKMGITRRLTPAIRLYGFGTTVGIGLDAVGSSGFRICSGWSI
jgi:hypothetical protein